MVSLGDCVGTGTGGEANPAPPVPAPIETLLRWGPARICVFVGPKFAGRLAVGIAVAACLCTPSQQARVTSSQVPMDQYERTLRALQQYRRLAAAYDGPNLPETVEPVEPGDIYEGAPRLARFLHRLGDLPDSADLSDEDVYQGELVTAVRRFQIRHGLQPDGRIDQATRQQLNTPLSFRVHQLEIALERWRLRPFDPWRPAIVLNIPEFRLRAFRANHVELEMKIVVGEPPDHKTPLLSSKLETIVFRPYWNVPLRLQREELVPEIAKDPTFLPANHLEMLNLNGDVVEGAVSDDMLDQLRGGKLRLRQTPGPKNVLGLVKFLFPNQYEIYMHATSAPWLFDRAERDLSHGCIRVERAEDLAEWALRGAPGWSRDRIEDAMEDSESTAVKLTRPIQLVTIYVTAMVLENGEVRFFDDIYGQDQAFEKELAGARLPASPHRPSLR